jgi:hypothetical protein
MLEELRKRSLLLLSLLTKGESSEVRKMIQDADNYQINLIDPKNFDSQDPENFLRKLEISFENLCTSLEELGVHEPHTLPVFRFYSKIQYFKKKKPPKK